MISLSQFLLERRGRMEDILLSMDSQLRLYLWTINEMNAIRCAAELQNANRNQIGVSHYKKRWRDRYIKPDSTQLNFEDPLKMMDRLVNSCHTYQHVMTFTHVLQDIIEDQNPIYVRLNDQNKHQNILKTINRYN